MNKMQTQLVSFLDAAIHNKKVEIDNNENIQWEDLIEESKAHKIEALIYSAIKNNPIKDIDKDLFESWKKDTFKSGVTQINHINQVSNVLNIFNQNNIPVIVLKGLVVIDLFPNPTLRTMCDADILVKEKDLENVKKLLIDMGYAEMPSSEKHLNFWRGYTHIEVHWTISDEGYFDNMPEIEESIWNDVVEVNVGNACALSMCDEDLALHLCIHMASHMIDRGFGIRQVVDLVLLVEQKGHLIDWDSFMEKARKCGVDKFTMAIFMVCKKLFNMDIPKQVYDSKLEKSKYIDILIDDIFSSGVHGKKDKAAVFAKELAYTDDNTSVFKRYLQFLFPKVENLDDKYNYAKRYKIFVPIAWIHHLFAGVFNKEYSLADKIKFGFGAMSISKKKNRLISWLEL